jgi:hypothetical protein
MRPIQSGLRAYDTDSYAPLVGAFIGARHAAALFPASLSAPVLDRLRAEYAVELGDWVGLLAELRLQSSTRPLCPHTPESSFLRARKSGIGDPSV